MVSVDHLDSLSYHDSTHERKHLVSLSEKIPPRAARPAPDENINVSIGLSEGLGQSLDSSDTSRQLCGEIFVQGSIPTTNYSHFDSRYVKHYWNSVLEPADRESSNVTTSQSGKDAVKYLYSSIDQISSATCVFGPSVESFERLNKERNDSAPSVLSQESELSYCTSGEDADLASYDRKHHLKSVEQREKPLLHSQALCCDYDDVIEIASGNSRKDDSGNCSSIMYVSSTLNHAKDCELGDTNVDREMVFKSQASRFDSASLDSLTSATFNEALPHEATNKGERVCIGGWESSKRTKVNQQDLAVIERASQVNQQDLAVIERANALSDHDDLDTPRFSRESGYFGNESLHV